MKEYLLKPITETAAQARQTKGQKGKIAKQIVLAIDAHLKGYQVMNVQRRSRRSPTLPVTDADMPIRPHRRAYCLIIVRRLNDSGRGKTVWRPNRRICLSLQRAKLCPDTENVRHSGFR
jgi:hypothetical protein